MCDCSPPSDKKEENAFGLPAVGQPVWVQCGGYRTMAYRDQDGKWRKLADGKKLTGNVAVIDET
jgi:hypothetical protein